MKKIVEFRLKSLKITESNIDCTETKKIYRGKIELLESILKEYNCTKA